MMCCYSNPSDTFSTLLENHRRRVHQRKVTHYVWCEYSGVNLPADPSDHCCHVVVSVDRPRSVYRPLNPLSPSRGESESLQDGRHEANHRDPVTPAALNISFCLWKHIRRIYVENSEKNFQFRFFFCLQIQRKLLIQQLNSWENKSGFWGIKRQLIFTVMQMTSGSII